MKKVVMKMCMNFIKKYNPETTDSQLEIVQYGLEGLYLTITKLIIILLLSYILNIWKEVIIFLIIYNMIRTTSFGLHATKSWICLLSSTCIFLGVPIICLLCNFSNYIKLIIGVFNILLMMKNAPADTYKRPIVSKTRRMVYKILSTVLSIVMVIFSILIPDQFMANCFLFALVVQNFMISPTIYRIFKLPYANYKNYEVNVA